MAARCAGRRGGLVRELRPEPQAGAYQLGEAGCAVRDVGRASDWRPRRQPSVTVQQAAELSDPLSDSGWAGERLILNGNSVERQTFGIVESHRFFHDPSDFFR